jgi:hypothetical protein
MSPQYYQYGLTSPSTGTPQPYNYSQIGFTPNPRAGVQAPQLGAQSPYIQHPTALIDTSFITPVPATLHSPQLQPPRNPRPPVNPPGIFLEIIVIYPLGGITSTAILFLWHNCAIV